jgi:hypothetical protein
MISFNRQTTPEAPPAAPFGNKDMAKLAKETMAKLDLPERREPNAASRSALSAKLARVANSMAKASGK